MTLPEQFTEAAAIFCVLVALGLPLFLAADWLRGF